MSGTSRGKGLDPVPQGIYKTLPIDYSRLGDGEGGVKVISMTSWQQAQLIMQFAQI
jgi:hypothetical protein